MRAARRAHFFGVAEQPTDKTSRVGAALFWFGLGVLAGALLAATAIGGR